MDEPTKTEGLSINRYWREAELHDDGFVWSAGYYDKDGCCYFDAESFIVISIFGFCGCGDLEAVLVYIREAMQEIKDHKDSGFTSNRLGQFAHSEGEKYLVWYVLDNASLTAHGGVVPGWLTAFGKEILQDLTVMYKENGSE